MRFQFILSEIGIGLRRNLTMTISVVLVTAVSLFLLGVGILAQKQVGADEGLLVRPGPGVDLPVRQGLDRRQLLRRRGDPGPEGPDPGRPELARRWRRTSRRSTTSPSSEAFERFKEQFKDSVLSEQRHRRPDAGVLPGQAEEPQEVQGRRRAVRATARASSRSQDQNQVLDRLFALLNGLQVVLLGRSPCVTLVCVGAAGGHDDPAVGVHPPPGDRHHAPGRRLEPGHPAAVHPGEPDRGRRRCPAGLVAPGARGAVRDPALAGRASCRSSTTGWT